MLTTARKIYNILKDAQVVTKGHFIGVKNINQDVGKTTKRVFLRKRFQHQDDKENPKKILKKHIPNSLLQMNK